jgi:hypothetical protein
MGRERRARRRGRGPRRHTRSRPVSPLPLRGAPLARWRHPRCRRGGREPAAPERRSRTRAAAARAGAASADARVGPRRTRRRRDVELELDHLLVDRPHRAGGRVDPPSSRRTRPGLAGRHRPGAPPSCRGASTARDARRDRLDRQPASLASVPHAVRAPLLARGARAVAIGDTLPSAFWLRILARQATR